MVYCELTFKCGEFNFNRCMEKSWLRGDKLCRVFQSRDLLETKKYIKDMMTNAIDNERNFIGDEYSLLANIIQYIISLERNGTLRIYNYCEIALR